MKLNRIPALQRREFLRRSAQLGLAGVAAPLALNLAALGEAAAADASGGYKALVCVFLYGGNDQSNTLVPVDAAGHANYLALRGGLGTPLSALGPSTLSPRVALGGGTQLALAPQLAPLKPLFDGGQLGVLLNVGPLMQPTSKAQYQARAVPLPPRLFSHNDQQSVWQSSQIEGATRGWGGAVGDLFLASNGQSAFTCINTSGNAVFMSGAQAVQYQVSSGGAVAINGVKNTLFGSAACQQALRALLTGPRSQPLQEEWVRVAARSIEAEARVAAALSGVAAFRTPFDNGNSLARQLQVVARLIAARSALNVQRQVFMVALGGFDNHDNLGVQHPQLLGTLANALVSFQGALNELNVANQVTTFSASEFGRTLTSNGNGSDHGWGSHQFVLGGAVRGQRFWGNWPQLANNGPDDVGQGRLLPSTAVDQLAATLARWLGVSEGELDRLLPRLSQFSQRDLGLFSA